MSTSLGLATSFLGREVDVLIDRPLGSSHPRHPDIVYGVNYGYLPGTSAPDGEELDAYVLGVIEPLGRFLGVCIALIHRLDDDDDKLVVAVAFQERFFESVVVRMYSYVVVLTMGTKSE